jgi:hypothetical protein
MTTIPENQTALQVPLATRWADAERRLLGNVCCKPPVNPKPREDHVLRLLDANDLLNGYHWANPRNQAIFEAAVRIAMTGVYPAALAIESELRRISNTEAADFAATLPMGFFSDAELLFWAAQCVELARACELYSSVDRIKVALDSGQTTADVAPLVAGLAETAKPADQDNGTVNAGDLLADNPPLSEPVIDGALRRGEVGLLIGAPKTCKSWAVLHLHCAMAIGGSWLGHKCRRGRSLLIDGELSPSVIGHRLAKVGELYGLTDFSSIDILSLRGDPRDIDRLMPMLQRFKPGDYDLASFDPIFKLLPADADENSNAYIAGFFRKIIAFTESAQLAAVCIHHASKGSQSGKSVSDMGAGGGAQSRSVDWHAALREHAEPGCVSLHTICRSFAPTPPSVWRMDPPEIVPMQESDPEDLRTGRPRKATEPDTEKPTPPNWQSVAALVNGEAHDLPWFSARLNMGATKTRELLSQAVAMGTLYLWPRDKKRDLPARWAREPERLV